MSEYVSKEELKQFFESIEITVAGRSRAEAISEVLQAIYIGVMELPTTDAEPVRHGKWIFNPSDAFEAMFAKPKCSECGFESADGGNYCPNCGAYMRGESDD